jgi:superfamily II DNA or RNA helicase
MPIDFAALEASIAALPSEKARGDAFERATAHLLRHDPEFGMRRVWGWRDWPGRAEAGVGRDLGIDLVAEDALGHLVGVQAKFRSDPDRLIRWEDVATAVGYRQGLFNRRLIVTNAWDRGPNAREALEASKPSTEPIGWLLRDAFLASEIDWSGALDVGLSGKAIPERHPRTPRPHQVTAIADTVAVLAEQPRAQLIMACGAGKTLTALWIAEEREDQRVLVLVPSLLLLRQFRRDWIESASAPFVDLVVCSDETTVGRDEISVRAADLGVPVTTDPAEIATFLRDDGRRVVFATYQSSERIADAQADPSVPAFDLVVADEAHKLAGVRASADLVQRDLRVVLDDGLIRADRRVFATATPRLYGPAAKARLEVDGADVEIAFMDDETVFGPVAHRLSFRSAVEQGILVDYELVVVAVTDDEVADLIERRAFVAAGGLTTDAESLAFLIALRKAIGNLGLRRSISFHSSIARARAFARWLPVISDEPPIPSTGHVAGTMPTGERNRIVERLRDPEAPTLITNARCLTEGIDVPALDAVAFVDPRGSHVDVTQAVGRAMRTAEGKTVGRVMLPVFLLAAQAGDPEAAVESSAFRPVLDVLRALRAHDEELSAEATRLRVELGRRATSLVESAFLRDHIRFLDVANGVDVAAFEQALDLRTVEVCAVAFEVALAELRAFAKREGHSRVPLQHREGDLALGAWAQTQRALHRKGSLAPERVAALEALPGWLWRPYEDDWQVGLERIRTFAAREGHARVPTDHVEAGTRLGLWVVNRRKQHRRGELPSERVAALEAIPGWTWDSVEIAWQVGLTRLQSFVAREGHARVPARHREDGYGLGTWVDSNRSAYRRHALDSDRAATLASLPGWLWNPRRDDWVLSLASLQAFVQREGHARVPLAHVEGGYRLGSWVNELRNAYRRGSIDRDRVAALEALPGWTWEPHDDDFRHGLDELRSYVTREGHARVPRNWIENGFALGSWVTYRRSDGRANRLEADRVAALEAITGWSWDPRADNWQLGLTALRNYVNREGHARVPVKHVEDGFRLGQWVGVNRNAWSRNRLSTEREAALRAIPGWAWRSIDETWERGLANLRAFAAREGHARVPVMHREDGFRLGSWVQEQRGEYKRGTISDEQIVALEAVRGWAWEVRPREKAVAQ